MRSTLTARHRRVPGSTFYVRAAPGYVAEESLNGLARPDGSLLEVLRVPEGNFLKVRTLVVEQYLAKRATQVQQHELQFNGYPAVFGQGASLEPGKDLMVLAFGDSVGFTLVFGLYPDSDAAAEAELRQMLLGGYYDARGQVPPLELAPFVISLAGTPYQLLEVRPADKTYVFGPAGSAGAVPDTFATRFTVQVLPPTPPDEARQRLLRRAQALTTPGALLQSQERQLPPSPAYGYEVSGSSNLRGRRPGFYQLIRTDEDATLIFHGVVFGAPAAAARPTPPAKGRKPAVVKPAADPLADFRKVAATLRMKR
ncbi:hypothetical protein DLM85_05010 [Hymenobacter edaphi]|uniref:Uncharacterized protein n=1 Tax=Hymenobacter edaphi TaxID=2211146 RepID=A0A328BUB9_9BACT|nr:hypothetical protein DLM85_05010 [Hymenobacter edaphi]